MTQLARFISILLLTAWATLAFAHSRGETWSSLEVGEQAVSLSYTLPASDLARYLPGVAMSGDLDRILGDAVTTGYRLSVDGLRCEVAGASVRQGSEEIEVRWLAQCPPGGGIRITNDALFEQLPNHLHIAQATMPGGEIREHLFTMSDRQWDLAGRTGLIETLRQYFELGTWHIITGYDHLAFLFAVILLTPRLVTLLLMVTGFTIAHSLTLALAVLGYATVRSTAVEALIGFTIALVAAEVVANRYHLQRGLVVVVTALLLVLLMVGQWGAMPNGPSMLTLAGLALFCFCYLLLGDREETQDLVKPILTFLFGLIHGFGFAGLLTDIGLPQEYLIPALIGFNLGVEVGQLAILSVVVTGGLLLQRRLRIPTYTIDTIAAGLCGLGLFLFVSRSFAST